MTTTTRVTSRVALVTLGCARNDVDSEELAGRLGRRRLPPRRRPRGRRDGRREHLRVRRGRQEGLRRHPARGLRPQGGRPHARRRRGRLPGRALRQGPRRVAARGRRRARLRRLPRHRGPTARRSWPARCSTRTRPQDRRKLLPISPADRDACDACPCPATPRPTTSASTRRPAGRAPYADAWPADPMAPLKLASGCDRRCSFCAIPSFRGSFVSRRPSDVARRGALAGRRGRARALPGQREQHVVRQGPRRPPTARDPAARARRHRRHRAGAGVLPPAGRDPARPGRGDRRRPRASADYFDLSFQHASATVLRRMRRFGDPESFLGLLDRVRALAPEAGVRSNVIVGFPGETEDDLQTLCDFLVAARLDVTGVFGYSDEDGTEAADLDRQARRRRDPGPGRARHRPGRAADQRAGRGADR